MFVNVCLWLCVWVCVLTCVKVHTRVQVHMQVLYICVLRSEENSEYRPSIVLWHEFVCLFIWVIVLVIYFFLFCVHRCCACMRGSDPWELEFQTVVSCCEGAGNWIWVLWQARLSVFLTARQSLQPVCLSFDTRSLTGLEINYWTSVSGPRSPPP